MKRVLTAVAGIPVMLAGIFLLSGPWFFLFVAFFLTWAAIEYLGIVRPRAPRAPLPVLLVLVPLSALLMSVPIPNQPGWEFVRYMPGWLPGFVALALLPVGLGALLLLSRTPLEETLPALGIFAFGVPYFAVPIASIYRLQSADPWLVFLLLAIVWLGDTAAFYIGGRFGRHKMAPVVSPKKSWEGAAAGFLIALAVAAAWSSWHLGRLDPAVLVLAAATAVAGQLGDLVESMLKRSTGIKDSGTVLPGHGGILDRCDAVLFAAPVLLIGVTLGHVASVAR
jgi:phosphatidate cytidylyltransferase